ncbi:hypothetical protein Sta7437_0750 [Stanieria cyanosphaera PCC 7437]|uniref:Uncharacterized protein n=1 Tax=Stanieria cyanosphaera (strain ATCC 29371 / PCC 7437) TaxID=111780 RepID=K9XQK8_STAC7|nr:hypothetical protein [Stanieria cyanosphaera]AFZ34341.1 hypothetical protein Sta7437_0750 [Stanieria cyanosphaera PCC 7437]
MQLTPFDELKKILEQLENSPSAGYHRIYFQTKLKKAIAAYDHLGILKYVVVAPRYHQLIKRVRSSI